jgi:hypothetical protein
MRICTRAYLLLQTDWALSGVQIRVVDNTQEQTSQQSPPLQGTSVTLPMASLEGKPGINGRLWATYLPVAAPTEEELQQGRAPRGVSSTYTVATITTTYRACFLFSSDLFSLKR